MIKAPAILATASIPPAVLERLRRDLAEIKDGEIRAIVRSVKRIAVRTRSKLTKEIAEKYGMKQKDVRKHIDLDQATFDRMVSYVILTGRRLPLEAFGAKGRYPSRGKGGGVTYQLGRHQAETAFIARMKNGHRGVMVRKNRINASDLSERDRILYFAGALHYTKAKLVDRKNRGGRVRRLPLHELRGVSVPVAFEDAPERAQRIMKEVSRDLVDELLQQTVLLSRREVRTFYAG